MDMFIQSIFVYFVHSLGIYMDQWVISEQDQGTKLLTFLQLKYGNSYSGRQIKQAIERSACLVNGKPERFASAILGRGDHVHFNTSTLATNRVQFEKIRIIYEDATLLIYNKPPNISCDSDGIEKLVQLKLIHRLDKDTTGLLMFAKDIPTYEGMVQLFREFQIKKSYLAVVDGVPQKKKGSIENYLGKQHTWQGQTLWGVTDSEKGLYACTEWVCEKTMKQSSLIRCWPKTGRTHQLRVHLADIGHPILGDVQYGKKILCPYQSHRVLLHAEKLEFPHPKTQKILQVRAPLPDDFIQALSILEERS